MGGGEVHTGFLWENLRVRDHFGDPGIEGRIILNGSSESWMWGYGPCIDLAQDRNRWRTLVNVVMNLQFP
jgi:hypothetical protein